MTSIFDDEDTASDNAPILTVSAISGAVKRHVEAGFGRVRVRGEVGRVSRPRSGHIYLDLKDDRSVLASVVWKGQAAKLGMAPEEGDEVVAEGRITTFAQQSRYQLVVESMAYAGAGALLAKLEKLKAALSAEGLFEPSRKKALPFAPRVIGVVTSPSGAVIRDILHRLSDRFPVDVLVWPVAVQGASCAPEVTRAVRGFNALAACGPVPRPDLLIVARGGGSIEDLWGFNEEGVARAVAASDIPVISAVGHETDTTLIDFAADRRAPTPSAAAEIATPVRADLLAALSALAERRRRAMARLSAEATRRARDLARRIPDQDRLLAPAAQRLDRTADALPRALSRGAAERRIAFASGPAGRFGAHLLAPLSRARAMRLAAASDRLSPARLARAVEGAGAEGRGLERRLGRAAAARLEAARAGLARSARLLETLSHKATLARGFALVTPAEGGAPITSAASLAPGRAVRLVLGDGDARATIDGDAPATTPGAAPRKRRTSSKDGQGTLF